MANARAFQRGVFLKHHFLQFGLNAATLVGVALGPFILEASYDLAGYTVAYTVAVSLCGLACVIIFFAGAGPIARTASDAG